MLVSGCCPSARLLGPEPPAGNKTLLGISRRDKENGKVCLVLLRKVCGVVVVKILWIYAPKRPVGNNSVLFPGEFMHLPWFIHFKWAP